MFKVLVIGNDSISTQQSLGLQAVLHEYFEFAIYTIPVENLMELIYRHSPDIVFMDLDVVEKSENTIQCINNTLTKVPLLIGSSTEYRTAFLALKNGFYDCVIKPYNPPFLLQTFLKCKNELLKKERSIFISSAKEVRYLKTSEISMLKADNNCVVVILADGKSFTVFNTLTHFQKKLQLPFLRVHKSYIINAQFVIRINYGKKFLQLKGSDLCIPFTKRYVEELQLIDSLKREESLW